MHLYVRLGLDFVAWGETQPVAAQMLMLITALVVFGGFGALEVLLASRYVCMALLAFLGRRRVVSTLQDWRLKTKTGKML